MATATEYSPEFYAIGRQGCQLSSARIVPMLMAMFEPRTVLDVGCGEGWFAKAFEQLGVAATGVDGPYVEPVCESFIAHDLREPLVLDDLEDRFDLVLSLEVAEHLPPEYAESFVAGLYRLGKTVVFSAAIPGQTGTDHINCQWPSYWAELFAQHGYEGTGALRQRIWTDRSIECWYRQNLLVFGDLGPLEPDGCPDLVHPEIWAWKL